jgi:hypothetical protein
VQTYVLQTDSNVLSAQNKKECIAREPTLESEGPDKATRGGGGEWEPIKIPRGNLAYIPNQTQRASLLTWPMPRSCRRAIGPRNPVRNFGKSKSTNESRK